MNAYLFAGCAIAFPSLLFLGQTHRLNQRGFRGCILVAAMILCAVAWIAFTAGLISAPTALALSLPLLHTALYCSLRLVFIEVTGREPRETSLVMESGLLADRTLVFVFMALGLGPLFLLFYMHAGSAA